MSRQSITSAIAISAFATALCLTGCGDSEDIAKAKAAASAASEGAAAEAKNAGAAKDKAATAAADAAKSAEIKDPEVTAEADKATAAASAAAAATGLPPVASTLRPNGVLRSMKWPTPSAIKVQRNSEGTGPRLPDPKKLLKVSLRIGIGAEAVIHMAMPLAMPSMPRVTRNDGIPTRVVSRPLISPTKAPTSSPAKAPATKPNLVTVRAAIAELRPAMLQVVARQKAVLREGDGEDDEDQDKSGVDHVAAPVGQPGGAGGFNQLLLHVLLLPSVHAEARGAGLPRFPGRCGPGPV